MKKLLFILSIVAVGFTACKKNEVSPTTEETSLTQVSANFSFHKSTTTPGKVTFTNLSTGYDYSEWKFGDGDDSPIDEPTHYYAENGDYTVQLIAKNYDGGQDIITKTVSISEIAPPATTGQRVFWISTANYGEITINVDGGNVGTITNYVTNGLAPNCGASGFVTIERPEGTYNFTATSTSGHSWNFTFTIENGTCKKTQLT